VVALEEFDAEPLAPEHNRQRGPGDPPAGNQDISHL
jgi:hypothetical protein